MYNHQSRHMGSTAPRGAYNGSSSAGYGGAGSSGSSAAGAQLGAWADWAARGLELEERAPTQLGRMIERACDPINRSPDLAHNLEVADFVTSKKANMPREAAMEVVRLINSRHPHVAMLALHLLDTLVKNCGYPFHLQIATKEFLNELVRRFPERPPMYATPTQSKILELIHEWKSTLCVSSKHKEDLVHIRDMHRLLGYKGYRFPNLDSRVAGVLNPETTLRSPEELEEEDREAQAAKLQELIRRGTPRDLEQAQELMVIMSGAEPEKKPDYKSQTAKELDKVQSRAILLNDMLNNANEGEKFAKGDAYDQISSHLKSVQPRLQKWIGEAEEGEDAAEHMDRLLLINDLINRVCERHEAFVKGDFSATAAIDPSIDPARGGADAVPTAKISDLIDFADEADAPSSSSAAGGANSLFDDFATLNFDSPAPAAAPTAASQRAMPSLAAQGKALAAPALTTAPSLLPTNLLDISDSTSSSTAPAKAAPSTATPPPGFGSWGAVQLPTRVGAGSNGGSGANTPKTQQPQQTQQKPAAAADPFGDLDALWK